MERNFTDEQMAKIERVTDLVHEVFSGQDMTRGEGLAVLALLLAEAFEAKDDIGPAIAYVGQIARLAHSMPEKEEEEK